ncbi:MAG: hypothetical protein GY847_33220, partial [Proteobacteria bacterium]|nr:hypothetical protein [Pseudomonadota bacterium]
QITRLAFQKKKPEKKQKKKKYGKGGGSLHGFNSPDDYSDDADTDHDYSGSECQMLDEHGNPWPRGIIRIDMRDGTTGIMRKSVFEGDVSRPVAKWKSRALTRSAQSEDWEEDVRQMELDDVREAERVGEPTLDLFNPLSLPMKRFWDDTPAGLTESIEMASPSPELTTNPEAEPKDLSRDEPMPLPEAGSAAGMTAPRRVHRERQEGQSRFQRFWSSMRETNFFTRPPLEPPTLGSKKD